MAAADKKKIPETEFYLKDVVLSFENLFDPQKNKNDKGEDVLKFHANFLMYRDDETYAQNKKRLMAAVSAAKGRQWGDNEEKWPKIKRDKTLWRDGDEEDWEGYAGADYVSCGNLDQPGLVDRTKDEDGKWNVLTKANGGRKKLYSGARVNVIGRVWAQDSQDYGKRINGSLELVQFNRHSKPFSQRAPIDANSRFDDVEEEEAEELDEGRSSGKGSSGKAGAKSRYDDTDDDDLI